MSNYLRLTFMVKTVKTLKLSISDFIPVCNIWTEHRHHWLDANRLLHIPLAEKDMFGQMQKLLWTRCVASFSKFQPSKIQYRLGQMKLVSFVCYLHSRCWHVPTNPWANLIEAEFADPLSLNTARCSGDQVSFHPFKSIDSSLAEEQLLSLPQNFAHVLSTRII